MRNLSKIVSLGAGAVVSLVLPFAALASDTPVAESVTKHDPSHRWVYENGTPRYHFQSNEDRITRRDFSVHDHHEFHGRADRHSAH